MFYRGITLESHTVKLWEAVVEARLRSKVTISKQQYDLMQKKSTTDAMVVGVFMEYREGQKELHCALLI